MIDYTRYGIEANRLRFMVERDGLEEALEFAVRTRMGYRRHILQEKAPRELRRGFIQSYLAFKRFINDYASKD